MFLLYDMSSDRHAGILNEHRLFEVLHQSSLQLDATLWISDIDSAKESSKPSAKKLAAVKNTPKYSLRIAIYGLLKDRDTTGGRFSDAGLFLQHPFADEIKPGIKYDNPHYLRRPGAEMPKLERLSLESMEEDFTHKTLNDELGKSRWLRIFDDADADGDGTKVANPFLSPRIRSQLMRYCILCSYNLTLHTLTLHSHQTTALAMMQEKECGYVEHPRFPALWQAERDKNDQIIQ